VSEPVHQRAFFRANAVAPVEVEHQGRVVEATMVDLSEAGVGMLVGHGIRPEQGDRLVVRIDCSERVVTCDAEVRWISPTESGRWRVGAQLLALTPQEERLIRRRVLQAQTRKT
jgi:c-di-GMP-binding flagellar brake protein YcgR